MTTKKSERIYYSSPSKAGREPLKFMNRKEMETWTDCPVCKGEITIYGDNIFDLEFQPCSICEGWGKVKPE